MNLAGINRHAKQNPLLAEALEDAQNRKYFSSTKRSHDFLPLASSLLDETGLSQAINWYVQGLMERSGLEIELDIAEDFGRLPGDLELAIFRIVQESLTGTFIAIPEAKRRRSMLSRCAHNVLLDVQDQGKGIPAEKLAAIKAHRTGVGIAGMRERIRHLKARWIFQSKAPVPPSSSHSRRQRPWRPN